MTFQEQLKERVLVLDGAMGTMIQRYNLTEDDFRGQDFADSKVALKGCNDLLCLTRPDVIAGIHRAYIDAGADIIETNSFNANALSLSEYGLSHRVKDINRSAARIAAAEAREGRERSGRQIFVAGSMGPGNISLSMPADPNAKEQVTFDRMADAYQEQAEALIEGGVDIILLETIFDTLNAKAAVLGVKRAFDNTGRTLPIMLSVTLTQTGRTLSGQTIDAFVASMTHAGAVSIGLNCGFGAQEMAPYLQKLQQYGLYISLHPNAGLPDEMGQYTQTPEIMGQTMAEYLDKGLLNIAGGCCGTTPEHIRVIAEAARSATPRTLPTDAPETDNVQLLLSGLEQTRVSPTEGFLKVGERCNVAGSRKFLRLINEKNYSEAAEIASGQIAKGAMILDINMDDGMLDTRSEMETFISMLTLDGTTAAVPLMIDSSRADVINAALRRIQGRAVVNSISLKEGEEEFLRHAREIRDLGAVPIVMAFDERGQATTLERRIEICSRAYRLLTEKLGLRGCDIIFDPNILTIATGMPEHDRYALDFLDTITWIKQNLPGAKVSGGVSNLSFAFRGNNPLREAMHTIFLHHAIARGMDMAIINPATKSDINTVDPTLREAVEDVIFCRREDASSRLLELASAMKEEQERRKAQLRVSAENAESATNTGKQDAPRTELTLQEMVVRGVTTRLEEKLAVALREDGSAMAVIKGRLMEGMNLVGDAFGAGRMFLPQVVRSAGVMKQAILWLTPYIEAEQSHSDDSTDAAKVILATVKGDVHDIGKNIVSVVLRCSGFEVIDLGVMVDADTIIKKAKEVSADFIGLSGLITPSLSEMTHVAKAMEENGLIDTPLFVGGATTSALHTAVKIAPVFSGLVVHTRDAASLPDVMAALADPARRARTADDIRREQQRLRDEYHDTCRGATVTGADPATPEKAHTPVKAPTQYGIFDYEFSPSEVAGLINWRAFMHVWHLPADAGEESERLRRDTDRLISTLERDGVKIPARAILAHAHRTGDDIVISLNDTRITLPTLRREKAPYLAMADYVAPEGDSIGLFAVTAGDDMTRRIRQAEQTGDDYKTLLLQSLADRLAEAATEHLHTIVHTELWGLPHDQRGIRPAIGYPSLPDQSLVFVTDELLKYNDLGIKLTENGALYPTATTTGLIFGNPQARYFEIGTLEPSTIEKYALHRGLPLDRILSLLPNHTSHPEKH